MPGTGHTTWANTDSGWFLRCFHILLTIQSHFWQLLYFPFLNQGRHLIPLSSSSPTLLDHKYPSFPWSLIPHSLGVSSKSPLSESPHSKFSPSSYREPDLMREFLLVLGVWGCLCSVPGRAILLEVSGLFRLYIFWLHDESGWIWDATSLPTPCH